MKSILRSKAHLTGIVILLIMAIAILNKDLIFDSIGDYRQLEEDNALRKTELYQNTYDLQLAQCFAWQGNCPDPEFGLVESGANLQSIVWAVDYRYNPLQTPSLTGTSEEQRTKRLAYTDAVRDYYDKAFGNGWSIAAKATRDSLENAFHYDSLATVLSQNETPVSIECDSSNSKTILTCACFPFGISDLHFDIEGPSSELINVNSSNCVMQWSCSDSIKTFTPLLLKIHFDSTKVAFPYPHFPLALLYLEDIPCKCKP